jgi:hypothetical protein
MENMDRARIVEPLDHSEPRRKNRQVDTVFPEHDELANRRCMRDAGRGERFEDIVETERDG